VTTAGVVTEYAISTSNSQPVGIAAGPDENMWFTETNASKLARVTTAGVITEYPTQAAGSHPYGITAGRDGNIWVHGGKREQGGQVRLKRSDWSGPVPTGRCPAADSGHTSGDESLFERVQNLEAALLNRGQNDPFSRRWTESLIR
jgi:hypothetical protein